MLTLVDVIPAKLGDVWMMGNKLLQETVQLIALP